jgi:hypothetical protein
MVKDLFAEMSAAEFVRVLRKLDLTVPDAARMLKVHRETARLYASGASPIPMSIAIAMRFVLEHHKPAVAPFSGPTGGA